MKILHAIAMLWVAAGCVAGATGCRNDDPSAPPSLPRGGLFAPGPRVPAATPISVRLRRTLSSESAMAGDTWAGAVSSNIVVQGNVVIPEGSRVSGVVREVRPAHRGDRAMLHLGLRSVTVEGRVTRMDADSDPVVAGSTRARNLGAIAGGAVAGALIGRSVGGDGDDAAKGALVGGGIATGAVAASKGYQVVLKEGSVMSFTTGESVAMR